MEVRQIKKRLVNELFLIIPKSAAKTLFATLVQAYFLTIDTSTTHQITVAYTTDQADETLAPAPGEP